ncbi:hypothetical protein FPZ43_17255 [Mucilaginibacter pallidiroseus]|uniref:Uncharacterized protein n=1 Tax=Mucilaginibacter pallidiroseus TaxID=2599295 RepID=A0A563U0R3_9SPHI|nr:hypothetical protein [Mucilaginibacter pallidiroseus]TWR25218.1 hypothetical protein FPZ43_17255 [Mucilaginibacter pallidiroseus]
MDEFYIDVKMGRRITRIQVDEVSPEQWDRPFSPQFIIEFHDGSGFVTVTLQLEDGKWYDRDSRLRENEDVLNLDSAYSNPLSTLAIQEIGTAIGRHMVVHLTAYMGLFVPVFRTPTLN